MNKSRENKRSVNGNMSSKIEKLTIKKFKMMIKIGNIFHFFFSFKGNIF